MGGGKIFVTSLHLGLSVDCVSEIGPNSPNFGSSGIWSNKNPTHLMQCN